MLILSLAGLVLGALISERDESEQKLSEEEARMRLLLESTGEAVYGVDNRGECTFCNQALLRLLGYASQGELLGRNIHDVIHHTRRKGTANSQDECSMQRELQSGKTFHVAEELLWRSDGTSFAALALETNLDAEQRDYLSMVKSSGESLLTLLNDILDLSKIEAGKLDLEIADMSMEDCIEEPLALRAQQKGIELVGMWAGTFQR